MCQATIWIAGVRGQHANHYAAAAFPLLELNFYQKISKMLKK